jgi:hypothetical protein
MVCEIDIKVLISLSSENLRFLTLNFLTCTVLCLDSIMHITVLHSNHLQQRKIYPVEHQAWRKFFLLGLCVSIPAVKIIPLSKFHFLFHCFSLFIAFILVEHHGWKSLLIKLVVYNLFNVLLNLFWKCFIEDFWTCVHQGNCSIAFFFVLFL